MGTRRLQRGIEVVNRIDPAVFGRILTRIVAKLHLKVRTRLTARPPSVTRPRPALF